MFFRLPLMGLLLCGVTVVSAADSTYPPKMPPPPTYEQALEEALKKHTSLTDRIRQQNQQDVSEAIQSQQQKAPRP